MVLMNACPLLYVQIEFWICLLLCFFGYLPGVIYAVWVIIRKEDD